MLRWISRLLPVLIVALLALPASSSATASAGGPLTGTWSGYISGGYGSGVPRFHVQLVINARETGGSWRISSSCEGSLALESISNGFHHYSEKAARSTTCTPSIVGNVWCLERSGAKLYDDVTSHVSGDYNSSGMLVRVR